MTVTGRLLHLPPHLFVLSPHSSTSQYLSSSSLQHCVCMNGSGVYNTNNLRICALAANPKAAPAQRRSMSAAAEGTGRCFRKYKNTRMGMAWISRLFCHSVYTLAF